MEIGLPRYVAYFRWLRRPRGLLRVKLMLLRCSHHITARTLCVIMQVEKANRAGSASSSSSAAVHRSDVNAAGVTTDPEAFSADPMVDAVQRAESAAQEAMELVDSLDSRHKDVSQRTSVLHAEFKRLVEDEARMRQVVERIYKPLSYFDSLFVIGKRLGMPFDANEMMEVQNVLREMQRFSPTTDTLLGSSVSAASSSGAASTTSAAAEHNPHRVRAIELSLAPDDEEFPIALERLDECIAFLASHAHFKDATNWLVRFKTLQARALGLIRTTVQESVDRVAEAATKELRAAQQAAAAGQVPAAAVDTAEMTQLQLRFRTELGHIRKLVRMVEVRAHKRAFSEILTDCYKAFLDKRLELLYPVIKSKLQRVADERTKSLLSKKRRSSLLGMSGGGSADNAAGAGSSSPSTTTTPSKLGVANPPGSALPSVSSTLERSASFRAGGGGSVYTSYTTGTTGTAGTRVTNLWSDAVTSREACVIDAARTCAAIMARSTQSEHMLFHSLFLTPIPGMGSGNSSALRSAGSSSELDGGQSPYGKSDAQGNLADSSRGRGFTSSGSVITTRTRATHLTAAGAGAGALASTGGVPSHVRTSADNALSSMQEEMCAALIDVLRPIVLSVNSLDVLCDVVSVLRDEVLGELAAPRGPSLLPLSRVVASFIGDVQERILFRAEGFVSERVEGFVPTPPSSASSSPVHLPLSSSTGVQVIVTSATVFGDSDFLGRLLQYYLRVRSVAAMANASGSGSPGDDGDMQHPDTPVHDFADNDPDSVAGGSAAGPELDQTGRLGRHISAGTAAGLGLDAIPPTIYDSWFPVLETTLVLLAKLYRALDRQSFESVAQDAVQACTSVLLRAAKSIAGNVDAHIGNRPDEFVLKHLSLAPATAGSDNAGAGDASLSSGGLWIRGLPAACMRLDGALSSSTSLPVSFTTSIDGHLFLVKNLLVLREQLSPFDMQLSTVTKSLDFKSTTDALSSIIAAPSSLFSFSRLNLILSLVTTGLPAVHEHKTDGKADLESLLKSACDALIDAGYVVVMGSSLEKLTSDASSKTPTTATPAEVASVLDAARHSFSTTLPALRRRLGLYLGSHVTASILFRPIKDRVLAALERLNASAHAGVGGGNVGAGPQEEESKLDTTVRQAADAAGSRSVDVQLKIEALVAMLHASDRLVTDPTSPAFGYDDAVVTSTLPRSAAVTGSASSFPAAHPPPERVQPQADVPQSGATSASAPDLTANAESAPAASPPLARPVLQVEAAASP